MTAKTSISSSARSKFLLAPVVWVLALAGFLLFFRLGDRPLRNPDEGRYAEIAREMVQSGDWVKPTVFGLGYLRKPPLFYWLIAGSFRLFGENEFSARAVPAFFGWLSVLLVYWFGRRFFDRERALAAALIFCTNFWVVQTARYLVIDSVYAFFVTASLFFFYAATREGAGKKIFPYLFFSCLGLAFLAKGPSALILAGVPAMIALVREKKWKIFTSLSWWAGLGLFFLIALPWLVLMARRDPKFLDFFLWHEHLQRFVASDFEHQEPWYFYLIAIPLLFVPWSMYRRSWVAGPRAGVKNFLWLAVSVMVAFFSLSKTKLPTYILPCFPLMALAAADSWKSWIDSKPAAKFTDLLPVIVLCFASLALIIGAPVFLQMNAEKYPKELAGDLQLLGGVVLAGSVLLARSLKRSQARRFFLSWVFLMAAVSLVIPRLMETMNPGYTNKSFAQKLLLHLDPKDEVFVYDHPGPFYDFEFYLNRPVKLVGLEGELEHFRQDARAGEVSVTREEFFSRIRDQKPIAAILRRSDFNEMDASLRAGLRILKQDRRKVLVRTGSEP